MQSILDLPPMPDSFLLIGTPGSGKTTLAMQLAIAQKKRLGILDCDRNLAGPVRYLKSIGANLSDIKVADPYTSEDGKPLDRSTSYMRMMGLLDEMIADPNIDFILIDSATSFVEFVMGKIRVEAGGKTPPRVGDNRKFLDGALRQEDWGTFFGVMKRIIFDLKASYKIICLTCHIRIDKDEMTGADKYFIGIPGQTSTTIAGWFSEAWFCQTVTEGIGSAARAVRKISTVGDNNQQPLGLKTSVGLPTSMAVNIKDISEKLSK